MNLFPSGGLERNNWVVIKADFGDCGANDLPPHPAASSSIGEHAITITEDGLKVYTCGGEINAWSNQEGSSNINLFFEIELPFLDIVYKQLLTFQALATSWT